MNISIISLLCPKCGAGVTFSEEDRVINCTHCGMNFIPIHSQGIEKYYFEPQVKNPKNRIIDFLKNKGFKKADYRIFDVDQFFIPVWKGTGQVTGWISGLSPHKTVTYTETIPGPNGRPMPVRRTRQEGEIPLKKLLRTGKEALFDAVKFPDIRWRKEEITKKEYANSLRLCDEENMMRWGKTITPDTSPQLKKKEIETKFISSSLSLYIDYKPLCHRLKVIGQRIFLYYFPISLFKVKLPERIIFLTLNGLSGKITSNAMFEPKPPQKKKIALHINTLMVFLAALLSASLIRSANSIVIQIGIVTAVVTLLYIWIRN